MANLLFDETADSFAETTDDQITKGTYVRGDLFVSTLKRHINSGGRVLDFGCGPGRIALMAANQGFSVEGFDQSAGMIEVAKQQAIGEAKISFGLCEKNGQDLKTGFYDAVICSSVIEYVEEPDTLLENFSRALKRSGLLLLTFSNKRSLWRAFIRRHQAVRPHHELQDNIWTFAQTRDRLAAAGFEVIEKPVFLEASTFDKRPALRTLSSSPLIGTLGFVVARMRQI